MYKIIKSDLGEYLLREDGAIIPFDENNRDYLEYLAWVADGNVEDVQNG